MLSEQAAACDWPAEVDLILSAMDAGITEADMNRRCVARASYRVRGELRLFSDRNDSPAWIVYTRDVDRRGLGFLTRDRLPLGYGGWIELPAPNGRMMKIHCTLFRCRPAASGWYEGALYFNREQMAFDRMLTAR
jgi:hypothetical protein